MLEGGFSRTVSSVGAELAVTEAGPPDRPTIVLLHGYPDGKEMWEPVIERLAGTFHVVAYDARGAGASSRPRGPAAYDFELLADDLEAVTRAAARGGRIHLVGHDWGGIQGWEFASSARFDGMLASFTSIAGPSLDQAREEVASLLAQRRVLRAAGALRRSWYVAVLCTPGAPTIFWRVVARRRGWAWWLAHAERVAVGDRYPSPLLPLDGVSGANLYRRNVLRRIVGPRAPAPARVPVQLIVPTQDHWISPRYYARAERYAPALRRRALGGSHWSPRTQPALIAGWVREFVEEVESGAPIEPVRAWVRGGGAAQLPGRLALVTGAGSGIGRATAISLGRHGVRLLVVDRDEVSVAQTAAAIPGAAALVCDVADPEAMEALAASVIGEHGVPDIVVNNAGIAVAGSFLDTEFADWRRVLDVNLMGVVHGARLFGRAMVRRGAGGQIVNTASAASFAPTRELAAYAASKAAVLMLSECLRAELGSHGIGVTAVCPGFIATNITRTARYVGRDEHEQQRLRDQVTASYRRRNFTPERVADEIVAAIAADVPVAVITPEAKLARALARFAPGLLRRIAAREALPV